MLHVHQHGVGECGIFTYEVAETKVTQVMDYARKHQHPLQCIMERNERFVTNPCGQKGMPHSSRRCRICSFGGSKMWHE